MLSIGQILSGDGDCGDCTLSQCLMSNGCAKIRRECVDPYHDLPGCDCLYGCTISKEGDLKDMKTVRSCLYNITEGPNSEEFNAQRKAQGNPVCRESLLASGFDPDEVLWSAKKHHLYPTAFS